MNQLKLTTDPGVDAVFAGYPEFAQDKMRYLRALIRQTAEEIDEVSTLEETLKWGEPSFITKHGSTVRIDWKDKTPDQVAMYFHCSTRLVDTFRAIFADKFPYETNRAIVFPLQEDIPEFELKACIKAALIYHRVKQQLNLGI